MSSDLPRTLEGRSLKFESLADDLRRGVEAGEWPVGGRLPTERQLSDSTGFSLTTVRRAIDLLVEEGIVHRRQGSGMYVVRGPRARRAGLNIGVLIPDTSLYFPAILQGIEAGLSGSSASLTLATSRYDPAQEREAQERLLEAGVDGVLITPILSDDADPQELLARIKAIPVPVVLLERKLHSMGYFDPTEYVCSNHEAGAFKGVAHLYDLGHRRIALCTRTESATAAGVRRGFDASPARLEGLAQVVIARPSETWLSRQAEDVLDELLANAVTAALVFGDREAALLETACQRRGVRIPEDLALVSYDDELANVAPVPLTAVSPAKHSVGRMAARLLLARISERDRSATQQISVIPRLIVRASCGAQASTP